MKNPIRATATFWSEMIHELKKASWPTWSELKSSTIVVIVGILLLGFYIGIIDFSLYQVVNLFSSWVRPITG